MPPWVGAALIRVVLSHSLTKVARYTWGKYSNLVRRTYLPYPPNLEDILNVRRILEKEHGESKSGTIDLKLFQFLEYVSKTLSTSVGQKEGLWKYNALSLWSSYRWQRQAVLTSLCFNFLIVKKWEVTDLHFCCRGAVKVQWGNECENGS